MSTASFRISYDGEALATHTMDVRDLAPSLLGLGEVFVEANKLLNGKDVSVEVHVTPNIHEQCFDIGLELVQQWEKLKTFLGSEDVARAKTLAELIFMGGTVVTATGGGLIYLLCKLRGKRPINVIYFKDENGNSMYRYQFDGDEDVILDEKLNQLYQSKKIRKGVGKLLEPVVSKPGIDKFTAYEPGKKDQGYQINKSEAQEIDFSPADPEEVASTMEAFAMQMGND